MTKRKVLLLISGILIILGVIMFGIGYFIGGGFSVFEGGFSMGLDGKIYTSKDYIKKDIEVEEFSSIDARSMAAFSIEIKTDDSFHIEYTEIEDNETLNIQVENGVLKMESNHSFVNSYILNFTLSSRKITIYAPESTVYDNISLATMSGNLTITDCKSPTKSLDLDTVSGSISVASHITNSIDASTTSGNIKIDRCFNLQSIKTSTTSGFIKIDDINADSIDFNSTSGNLAITDATLKNLNVSTTSGNTDIKDSDITSNVESNSISGNFSFSGNLNSDLTFSSTSGHLNIDTEVDLSRYTFKMSSSSGKMRINGNETSYFGTGEYSITANTMSGNANISA